VLSERCARAKIRRDWVAGELAAMRVPNLRLLGEAESADAS